MMTLQKPEDFFAAMMEKFQLRAKEKVRSQEPWKDFEEDFLIKRLNDEITEFHQACNWPDENEIVMTQEAADELIDVANFCMFLWLRWQRKGE